MSSVPSPLMIDNKTITCNLKSVIRFTMTYNSLLLHVEHKNDWTDLHISIINWCLHIRMNRSRISGLILMPKTA